jgi:hypothetical protein
MNSLCIEYQDGSVDRVKSDRADYLVANNIAKYISKKKYKDLTKTKSVKLEKIDDESKEHVHQKAKERKKKQKKE